MLENKQHFQIKNFVESSVTVVYPRSTDGSVDLNILLSVQRRKFTSGWNETAVAEPMLLVYSSDRFTSLGTLRIYDGDGKDDT